MGSPPREGFALAETSAGPHRIAYRDWGDAELGRTVVCVHGLTGCARDFDVLAPALVEAGYRVVCPDVVGRGNSDRLADPGGYQLGQYVADMAALLAQLELSEVDWVGTSMGGLIGMASAAAEGSPIRRLVMNDIGPFVPRAALQRLDAYVGDDPPFADLAAAEAYLRTTRAPFGKLTDEQWRTMAERATRADGAGGYRLQYDPAIMLRFHETADEDADLWRLWDALTCPVLVLRGESSDLLLAETAAEMTARGPGARIVELAGCGHAPALLDVDQISVVVDWLTADATR